MLPHWLIMTRNNVMMGVMLMAGYKLVHLVLVDLHSYRAAVTAGNLHRNRRSQCATAEQRQPDGQKYRNKLSDWTEHGLSLAKFSRIVKWKRRAILLAG